MDKINTGKGNIKFVIANYEDYYYMSNCIRLNFFQYMYITLFSNGFNCVYYISNVSDNQKNMKINFFNEKSKSIFDNKYSNFLKNFCGLKKLYDKDKYSENYTSDIIEEKDISNSLRVFGKIKNTKIAIIISGESFVELESNDLLMDLMKKNSECIIIILLPVDSQKALKLIAPDNNSKKYYDTNLGIFKSSVFSDKYRNLVDIEKGYSFIMEDLESVMNEQLVFLNTLDKEDITNMVKHFFYNNVDWTSVYFEYCDWFSEVIWAWYNIGWFRNMYEDIKLPDNPNRKISVIEQSLNDDEVFESIIHFIDDFQKKNKDYDIEKKLRKLVGTNMNIRHNIFLNQDMTEFSEKIERINRIVFEVAKHNNFDFQDSEVLKNLSKIETEINRFIILINPDEVSDNLVYENINMISKMFDGKSEEYILSLIDDGRIFDILRKIIVGYYKYMNDYRSSGNSPISVLYRRRENLYNAIISLIDYIYMRKVPKGDYENYYKEAIECENYLNKCINGKSNDVPKCIEKTKYVISNIESLLQNDY